MTCSVAGCFSPSYCKGLCQRHYTLAWRKRQGGKYEKKHRAYMKKYIREKRKSMTEEERSAAASAHAKYQRGWRARHAVRLRVSESYGQRYLRRYGLLKEDFELLLKLQKGVCAICKKSPRANKRLAVDHDHKTGAVRGLLCDKCNHALGELDDSPSLFRSALRYLSVPSSRFKGA